MRGVWATGLGPEIGHAIARHGVERISKSALTELGTADLEILLGQVGSQQDRGVLHQPFGIGTHVGNFLLGSS